MVQAANGNTTDGEILDGKMMKNLHISHPLSAATTSKKYRPRASKRRAPRNDPTTANMFQVFKDLRDFHLSQNRDNIATLEVTMLVTSEIRRGRPTLEITFEDNGVGLRNIDDYLKTSDTGGFLICKPIMNNQLTAGRSFLCSTTIFLTHLCFAAPIFSPCSCLHPCPALKPRLFRLCFVRHERKCIFFIAGRFFRWKFIALSSQWPRYCRSTRRPRLSWML
jgi:hypothetical protein